jgi:hypothetical protein
LLYSFSFKILIASPKVKGGKFFIPIDFSRNCRYFSHMTNQIERSRVADNGTISIILGLANCLEVLP